VTRLQSKDILNITSQLKAYDDELMLKTGHNLRQIACHATQLTIEAVQGIISRIRVGVVPIQWGLGKIDGFCEAVTAILKHIGFDPFVTVNTDIAGLAEAYASEADVIFLADDNDFIALNAETRQSVHNSAATGKGFTAGLDLMARGLAEQKVLILGCGAVGQSAITASLSFGAQVTVYDINSEKCRMYRNSFARADSDRITLATDIHAALSGHTLVVDATNAAGFISTEDLSPQTLIAAPGIPLGLSRDAGNMNADRLLHDPLQIGVATMGMEIVKQLVRN